MNVAIRSLILLGVSYYASFLVGVSCYASTPLASPTFEIVALGLTGPEHTRNDGYEYSSAVQMNEMGQVRGFSNRYNGGSTHLGQSAWLYDGATTIDIGLVGPEHTRNDGYKYSSSYSSNSQLNQAGQVSGFSDRFNGGSADMGQSTWLYDGTSTIPTGLTGLAHTRSDGYKYSVSFFLNEAGQVTGQSQLFSGDKSMGFSGWLYNGATTIDLTLKGPEYTRSDGYRATGAYDLNESGYVNGSSQRYRPGPTDFQADLGNHVWVYDGVTTKIIGLFGPEHTRNDDYKRIDAFEMNKAGQVRGYAQRYNGGSVSLGFSAWLYDGSTTRDIGLTGPEHTRNNGYKNSYPRQLNEAGQVSGHSDRYSGGSALLGDSAWLYNGTTTIDIGLVGPEHTRSNGFKYSDTEQLNEAGQVRGFSYRYSGSTYFGRSLWLYNGATTINVGLTGPEHTRNDGFKESYSNDLNEVGQVSGYSLRFNGGNTDLGQTAWLYNGATTIDIGLTGPQHTRTGGYKFSLAEELNDSGQASGYSYRYNAAGTQLGQDAWFYDSILAQTIQLQLSSRSDGYAYSSLEYLGDDGLALGEYRLFNGLNNDLGLHAFYFTIADGWHDLGSLVNDGLAANGWESLANAIRANNQRQILGHGKLTSQSGGQMAYLLTPVPEPSTVLLATFGVIGWLSRRRRQCAHASHAFQSLHRLIASQ